MLHRFGGLKRCAEKGLKGVVGWRRSVRPYSELSSEDVAVFRRMVGEDGVLWREDGEEAAAELDRRGTDWTGKWSGRGDVLVKPRNTWQVAEIVRHCHEADLAVVPVGGNTGLVGGSVPVLQQGEKDEEKEVAIGAASGRELVGSEVFLSLERLRKVRELDAVSGVVTLEAGLVVEEANAWLNERGFELPLDLGSKGSCQIGGVVSTHAGGLRVVRFGSLRGSILGLEVVLADGQVLDVLSGLKKDNMGLSLPQLFVGTEGSLGVVTAAKLAVPRVRVGRCSALVACESFESVLQVLTHAQEQLGECLSAVEFWDDKCMDLVLSTSSLSSLSNPIDDDIYPFYVLVEAAGADQSHTAGKMETFVQHAFAANCAITGVLADAEAQTQRLFALRESITLALSDRGPAFKYDFSLPTSQLYDLVPVTHQHLQRTLNDPSDTLVVGYGHLGDGNVHLNVSLPHTASTAARKELAKSLEPWIFHQVLRRAGSISAEHGLGLAKGPFLHLARPPTATNIQRGIKRLLDPKGILNPGKGPDAPDFQE